MHATEWDVLNDGRRLEAVCDSLALTCLLPTERFRATEATGARLYFDEDAHWNAAGHYLAAQILADYVLETLNERRLQAAATDHAKPARTRG